MLIAASSCSTSSGTANRHRHVYPRRPNELPVLILIGSVVLVVVKPVG